MIISRSFLLKVGNISDKSWTENQNKYSMFLNIFSPENRALY